jgi:hypothetical protein
MQQSSFRLKWIIMFILPEDIQEMTLDLYVVLPH